MFAWSGPKQSSTWTSNGSSSPGPDQGCSGLERLVAGRRKPLPCALQPLLAACGQSLPALPQSEGFFQACSAGLQPAHHRDELLPGFLVAQPRDVRLRFLFGHAFSSNPCWWSGLPGCGTPVDVAPKRPSATRMDKVEPAGASAGRRTTVCPDAAIRALWSSASSTTAYPRSSVFCGDSARTWAFRCSSWSAARTTVE